MASSIHALLHAHHEESHEVTAATALTDMNKAIRNISPSPSRPPPNTDSIAYPLVPLQASPTLDAKKKKRITKACEYCNRSHMSCDEGRPCKRCIDRGISALCRDHESKKKRGRKANYLSEQDKETLPPTEEPATPPTKPAITGLPSFAAMGMLPPPSMPPPRSNAPPTSEKPQPQQQQQVTRSVTPTSSFSNILRNVNPPNAGVPVDNSSLGYTPEMKTLLADFFSLSLDDIDKNWKRPDFLIPLKFDDADVGSSAFFDFIRSRAAHEVDSLIAELFQWRESVKRSIGSLHPDDMMHNLEGVKSEIAMLVQTYKTTFEPLAVPGIIYNRHGVIYYVNPAYKALTNFSMPLPTSRADYTFFKNVLSPDSLRDYFKAALKPMKETPKTLMMNYIFNGRAKVYTDTEQYIDGTWAISMKRDHLGLPFLKIATFLPKYVPPPL